MPKSGRTKSQVHQYSAKTLYLRMLKYALRYWQVFAFSIVALVGFSATNTGFLATIKLVTDAGFVKHDSAMLHLLPFMLFGLLTLRAFAGLALKRMPLEKRIRLLGVRVGHLSKA